MANGIYDSTWWGNTIQTAVSIGTVTEMIQGQFNMNDCAGSMESCTSRGSTLQST